MPKFSWKKFLAELARTLLPIVVTQIHSVVAEKLEPDENGPATGENDRDVVYGRRSTDTFEEAEHISREISTPVQR